MAIDYYPCVIVLIFTYSGKNHIGIYGLRVLILPKELSLLFIKAIQSFKEIVQNTEKFIENKNYP